MSQTPAARRYARALFELAKSQQADETVGDEISQLVTALAEPSVVTMLNLPTLSRKTRNDIVGQIVTAFSPQPLLATFLHVLAENDRLSLLDDIDQAYQRLLEQAMGKIRAHIRSASPLADAELRSLVDAFGRLMQKTIIPTVETDQELLGGVIVEIEGRVYDASLRTQIRRLGDTLAKQL